MLIRMRDLRWLIREALADDEDDVSPDEIPEDLPDSDVGGDLVGTDTGAGGGETSSTKAQGFYDYEYDMFPDIYSKWYRSPGQPMGTAGDFRPEDAKAYLGMTPPSDDPTGSAGGAGEGEEARDVPGDESLDVGSDTEELDAV